MISLLLWTFFLFSNTANVTVLKAVQFYIMTLNYPVTWTDWNISSKMQLHQQSFPQRLPVAQHLLKQYLWNMLADIYSTESGDLIQQPVQLCHHHCSILALVQAVGLIVILVVTLGTHGHHGLHIQLNTCSSCWAWNALFTCGGSCLLCALHVLDGELII